ncbi:MAG: hypothetical protein Q8S00_03135, partial [Deltaproteobacteria bacterium]|nr:hypothetical protein [Deltaproteobacteria bacterium]
GSPRCSGTSLGRSPLHAFVWQGPSLDACVSARVAENPTPGEIAVLNIVQLEKAPAKKMTANGKPAHDRIYRKEIRDF